MADKGQLILAMSGDYRSKKEVAFLLVPAVGRKVVDLGESIQKGTILIQLVIYIPLICNIAHIFKLLGNSMIMGVIEIMAEAMTTAEKAGIGSETVYSFIKGAI